MKRSKTRCAQRATLCGVLAVVGLGPLVGGPVGVPRANAKSTTTTASVSTRSVLNRLLANGLRLSTGERSCAEGAGSNSATKSATKRENSVGAGSGFNQIDESVTGILRCVSQDHAVTFVAGALEALAVNPSVVSGAFLPNESTQSTQSTKTCLERRLRIATWPEVSEVFRSYVDVLLDASPGATAVLSSRVQPYVRMCAALKDSKGITPLPALTLEEFRVRWNASVARHGTVLSKVTRWSTPGQVGLPDSAGASTGGVGSTQPHIAVLALNSWVDVALSASDTQGANVAGASIVLEPPTASEAVASEALYVLADAIDGRDQAQIVHNAIDISGLLATGKAVDRRVRIGRTYYGVAVAEKPIRIFISAFPS